MDGREEKKIQLEHTVKKNDEKKKPQFDQLTIIKVKLVKVHALDKIAQWLGLETCYFTIAQATKCLKVATCQRWQELLCHFDDLLFFGFSIEREIN